MAGTRGIAGFRGEQLRNGILRDYHFDADNKISEDKIDIRWAFHREILEATKIDVRVQVNDKAVAGLSEIDVTTEVGGRPVSTSETEEGVVTTEKVLVRVTGTDSPIGDDDADVVYGKIEEDGGTFLLKFYSIVDGKEQLFTFPSEAGNIDFQFVVRTNLSIIPVDAIINGGAGFVEGATDAKAYMNLIQLAKDLYGDSWSLDNDGKANLGKSVAQMITDEGAVRRDEDQAIRDDLVSTASSKGASLVGVVTDPNYTGITVQDVLIELASKLSSSQEGQTGLEDRVTKLETADEEEVYEATGGETEYLLVNGVAKPKSILLFINGAAQAPGINFDYKKDGSGNITGFNFAPDTLKVTNGVPDVLLTRYRKVL